MIRINYLWQKYLSMKCSDAERMNYSPGKYLDKGRIYLDLSFYCTIETLEGELPSQLTRVSEWLCYVDLYKKGITVFKTGGNKITTPCWRMLIEDKKCFNFKLIYSRYGTFWWYVV